MEKEFPSTYDMESSLVKQEYFDRIDYYKEIRKKYNLIDSGKEIGELFNISLANCLNGYNHDRLNLLSKYTNIVCGLDSTNLNIIEIYEIWEKLHPDSINFHNTLSNTYYITRLRKLIEYTIYDFHTYINQIISIVWLIKYPAEKKFQIYDIGSYLNIKREKEQNNIKYEHINFNYFDEYFDFIQILNNIFNSNKHSPTNNEQIILGTYEIVVSAIKMRDDTVFKDSKLFVTYFEALVTDFNEFYKYSINLIDTLTKENKS